MTDMVMHLKGIVDEDFTNYKIPSMFIGTAYCNWKCCVESGFPLSVCQNSELDYSPTLGVDLRALLERYAKNPITHAVVFGGLEPFEQFDELRAFIAGLREDYACDDPIVIYTGFNEEEIAEEINALREYPNIIVKFGRYVPGEAPHLDDLLGVSLASPNQYAKQITPPLI